MTKKVISAIILTHNEEDNICACLESIQARYETFVVDSGSTDRTIDVCANYGVRVFHHAYENHASQWKWALENVPISTTWVLALDADFVITPSLIERIDRDLVTIPDDVDGVYVRHLYKFGWGTIRRGGTKKHWLRIVRHNRAWPDAGDLVDFRFVVDRRTIVWNETVLEYNRKDDDISIWLSKQDKFALRLAVEEELRRRGLHGWDSKPRLLGTVDERFAWLRDRWLKLPLFVRPVLYFLYRYIIAAGALDGRAGFLYHVLQGFWLRLIVDWKTVELRNIRLDDEGLRVFGRLMLETRSGSVSEVHRLLQQRTRSQFEPVEISN